MIVRVMMGNLTKGVIMMTTTVRMMTAIGITMINDDVRGWLLMTKMVMTITITMLMKMMLMMMILYYGCRKTGCALDEN